MKFPGKILDRYIFTSVAGAFLFGIAMFMGLLLAMNLLTELIKLIAERGVPVLTALHIFAFRIPSMLVYAFPMSVLLGILLVFNQMSSESEMVAIRASGISFLRIVVPTLLFALIITGITFWISNNFCPYANNEATRLEQIALQSVQKTDPISYIHADEKGHIVYGVDCPDLNIKAMTMRQVTLTFYTDDAPSLLIYAPKAHWEPTQGRWHFYDAHPFTPDFIKQSNAEFHMSPINAKSQLYVETQVLLLKESPFDLASSKLDPNDFTAKGIRNYINRRIALNEYKQEGQDSVGYWRMALSRRFAMPFYCLVFALIAAPLGLRHHRTSSAMGLGISLLVIFAFYFTTVYMSMFGESGRMSTIIAAWTPNIIGALLGIALIVRANK